MLRDLRLCEQPARERAREALPHAIPSAPDDWPGSCASRSRVEFFQRHVDDDPAQSVPGRDFLDKVPDKVAARMVAVLEAVAAAPPPAYSGGGYWEAMHDEMAGFFEVRIDGSPNRTHYRLFCVLERDAEKIGLDGPSVVVIAGKKKPFRSVLSKQDYAQVRRLGDEFRSRVPRSVLPRSSTRASE